MTTPMPIFKDNPFHSSKPPAKKLIPSISVAERLANQPCCNNKGVGYEMRRHIRGRGACFPKGSRVFPGCVQRGIGRQNHKFSSLDCLAAFRTVDPRLHQRHLSSGSTDIFQKKIFYVPGGCRHFPKSSCPLPGHPISKDLSAEFLEE